jgi:hypothetical protein
MAAMRLAHAAWHAAELFCIRAALRPNEASSVRVIEWLSMNVADAEADASAADRLAASDTPERVDGYWALVCRLAARGRAHDAATLLSLHSALRQRRARLQQQQRRLLDDRGGAVDIDNDDNNDNDNATLEQLNVSDASDASGLVRALRVLLRRMPPLEQLGTPTFGAAWHAWRAACGSVRERHRRSGNNDGTPMLAQPPTQLLSVLCGDEAAIERTFVDPYERLGALVTFGSPLATADDVANTARRCFVGARGDTLADVLVALLGGDAHNALVLLEQRAAESPAGWLVAHLGDLLRHAGALETHALADGADAATRVRRARLLRYADALDAADAARPLCWALRCDYWSAAGAVGLARAQLRLARASLGYASARGAARIVAICARLGAAGRACVVSFTIRFDSIALT